MWQPGPETLKLLSAIADVAAIPSIGINLFLLGRFLVRSYRTKSFFSGQWKGTLSDCTGSLDCLLIFYCDHAQLTAQMYYEGQYEGEGFVSGFDRLPNDSTRFACLAGNLGWNPLKMVRWLWRRLVGTTFEARFERVLHSTQPAEGVGGGSIERLRQPYIYTFKIHTRFFHPRLTCMVATQPADPSERRCFTGELVKQGNG